MTDDSPIVAEVRKRRMDISAACGHDPRRFFALLRRNQDRHRDRLVSQISVIPRHKPEHSPAPKSDKAKSAR